jgi:hypothetical protein
VVQVDQVRQATVSHTRDEMMNRSKRSSFQSASWSVIVEEWPGKRIFVAPRDNRVDGSPTGAGRRTNRLTMEKMVPLAPISRLTSNNHQPSRDVLLSPARSAAETSQDVPARSADQTLQVIRTGKSTKLRRGNQDSRSDAPHDQNFVGN